MQKIIGYCRESTDWQVKFGYNLSDQEKKIRLYYELNFNEDEYELSILLEKGESGTNLHRPMMEHLLEQISNNTISYIIVFSLDRLTRSLADFNYLLELLEEKNISIISIQEHLDTSSDRLHDFLVQMIVLISQLEIDELGDRVLRGITESASQGNYAFSGIPFGYSKNSVTGTLEIVDEEAEIVRFIFDQVIHNKTSCNSLAVKMTNNNVLGKRWHPESIRSLIENSIYYGEYEWRGIKLHHISQPIVSYHDWISANTLIHQRPYVKHNYYFECDVTCKSCGNRMDRKSTNKSSGKIYLYYYCSKCNRRINEDKVKLLSKTQLEKLYRDTLYMSDIHKCVKELHSLEIQRKRIIRHILNGSDINEQYRDELENNNVLTKKKQSELSSLQYMYNHCCFTSLSYLEQSNFIVDSVKQLLISFIPLEITLEPYTCLEWSR